MTGDLAVISAGHMADPIDAGVPVASADKLILISRARGRFVRGLQAPLSTQRDCSMNCCLAHGFVCVCERVGERVLLV